jgi:hypothetical protein
MAGYTPTVSQVTIPIPPETENTNTGKAQSSRANGCPGGLQEIPNSDLRIVATRHLWHLWVGQYHKEEG